MVFGTHTYDTADHVANLRAIDVTPHVTQNNAVTKTGRTRNSAIDERTTRHPRYGMSQSRRAMTECIFGWGKQHGKLLGQAPGPFQKSNSSDVRTNAADLHARLRYGSPAG
jgi:hypothetical protein